MLGYVNRFRGIYYLSDRTASGKSYLDGDSTEMYGEGYGEGCCVSISAQGLSVS